jgi:bifunctional DNase/RNase
MTYDSSLNEFVVILSDLEDRCALPMIIGPFEANAILMKMNKTPSRRPMTHDLIRNILGVFDSEITKVEVTELKDTTYYSLIHVRTNEREFTIESRPSDAIALAVGADVPLYVCEKVLYRAKAIELSKDMDEEQLEEILKSLEPEDFQSKA